MKTEKDYLEQYLTEWKESVLDLFTTDETMSEFLRIKATQFDLEFYKKSLKK